MDPSQLSLNSLSLNESAPPHNIEQIYDSNSENEEEENQQEDSTLKSSAPYFFPPLWLARRSKVFEILKEEGIGSVCDIGCGEGNVLSILASPATHLDDFPSIYPPSPVSKSPLSFTSSSILPIESSKERKRNILLRIPPRPKAEGKELHLRRLVGIDVDKNALESAIRITEPIIRTKEEEEEKSIWSRERERWEELRVEIYLGSAFEVYNEALVGLDAMFATEVIEHLSDVSLAKVSSMVLGVYQPRVFIVTTPNHEFNPYFPSTSTAPKNQNRPRSTKVDEEDGEDVDPLGESAHRFSDPTLRTDRVFRDADHQFEWTQSEFETWAKQSAKEHDYTVSFTGVGSLGGYYGFNKTIPFPPPSLDYHPSLKNSKYSLKVPEEPLKFYATQIAIFKRHYSQEVERSPRSHQATTLPFFSPPSSPTTAFSNNKELPSTSTSTSTKNQPAPQLLKSARLTSSLLLTPHQHLKTHIHPAHPSLLTEEDPISSSELLKLMSKISLEVLRSSRISLRDYWNQPKIRLACQGKIGAIVDAVLENGEKEGEEDDWDFFLIESGAGREVRGDEALGILWKRYDESLEARGGYRDYDDEDDSQTSPVEEDEDESDQEWRKQADEFLVDDFDTVEEEFSWVPKINHNNIVEDTVGSGSIW